MLQYFIHFIGIRRIFCGKIRWYESSYKKKDKVILKELLKVVYGCMD